MTNETNPIVVLLTGIIWASVAFATLMLTFAVAVPNVLDRVTDKYDLDAPPALHTIETPDGPVNCAVWRMSIVCDWLGHTQPPQVTEYRAGPNGPERVDP